MTTQEKIKDILANKEQPKNLENLIESSAKELGKALPEHMRPERLVRIALTAIRMNPDLAKCTPESFLGALFTAAQIGLEPVSNQAYLIPFNNTRKIGNEWKTIKECQFVMGYGGLTTLFYRHEKAITISWGIVYEKDYFDYQKGTEHYLHHKPTQDNKGNILGYYAIAHLQSGGKIFEYLSKSDCIAHGQKHSKTYDKEKYQFYSNSPWATNTDAMCLKTVLKMLGKLMPLSYEMHRALAADETSREYRPHIGDMLDIPSTTTWDDEENKKESQDLPPENSASPEPQAHEQAARGEETTSSLASHSNASLVEGKIENVTTKQGVKTDEKGIKKSWQLWTIHMPGGENYKTFSKTISQDAMKARELGMKVEILYKDEKFGHEILEMKMFG